MPQHKDVDFEVVVLSKISSSKELYVPTGSNCFNTYDEALSHIKSETGHGYIDVIVWSEEGAQAYGGDDALEQYLEDPEASVHERIEIRNGEVHNLAGRIP